MRTRYADLNLCFTVGRCTVTVLSLVYERFLRSIPKHSHSNYSYEMHFISAGRGSAVIDGRHFALCPNTLYVTGPGVEHEQVPDLSDPMEEYCVYLKIEPAKKSAFNEETDGLMTAFLSRPFYMGQGSAAVAAINLRLFEECKARQIGYLLNVQTLLQQYLVELVRRYVSAGDLPTPDKAALADLNEQKYIILEECFLYESSTLTLPALAQRLMLSTRQTERLLKAHYGKTFLKKRQEARMSAAATLLSTTNKSVTQISLELGYSSVEHFSNAFKQYYGISALKHRNPR